MIDLTLDLAVASLKWLLKGDADLFERAMDEVVGVHPDGEKAESFDWEPIKLVARSGLGRLPLDGAVEVLSDVRGTNWSVPVAEEAGVEELHRYEQGLRKELEWVVGIKKEKLGLMGRVELIADSAIVVMEKPERIDTSVVRALAVQCSADPRSIVRVLKGLPVKGMAGARITRILTEIGILDDEGNTTVPLEVDYSS